VIAASITREKLTPLSPASKECILRGGKKKGERGGNCLARFGEKAQLRCPSAKVESHPMTRRRKREKGGGHPRKNNSSSQGKSVFHYFSENWIL